MRKLRITLGAIALLIASYYLGRWLIEIEHPTRLDHLMFFLLGLLSFGLVFAVVMIILSIIEKP